MVGLEIVELKLISQNLKNIVNHNRLLFENDIFKVEPAEGVVWPNSAVTVNVLFRPEKAGTFNDTIFCDISGRETRLPLQVTVS